MRWAAPFAFALLALALVAATAEAIAPLPVAGEKYVFGSSRSDPADPGTLGYHVWVRDAAGERRVTSGGCFTRGTSWSPSGADIVFAQSCSTGGESDLRVQLIHPDGTDRRTVTAAVDNAEYPDFSPSGTRIVFTGGTGSVFSGRFDVYTVGVDGSGLRRLTTTSDHESMAHYSPDGATILYTRSAGPSDARFTRADPVNLWLINADGTDPRPLTVGGGFLAGAGFSPDGRSITFSNNGQIYVTNLDGTDFRARTPGGRFYDVEPTYAPNGRSVVFERVRRDPGCDECGYRVTRLDLASGTTSDVTDDSPNQTEFPDIYSAGIPVARGVPDRIPPVTFLAGSGVLATAVRLVGSTTTSRATAAASRTVRSRRSELTFMTLDRSGVRSTAVAVQTPESGGRCRTLGPAGLSPLRSCGAPRYLRVRTLRGFRQLVARLPLGRYRFSFQAVDRNGNRARRPPAVAVQLTG